MEIKNKYFVHNDIVFFFIMWLNIGILILKSIEKKLNSGDLNDYDLLMVASIYFNEQVYWKLISHFCAC